METAREECEVTYRSIEPGIRLHCTTLKHFEIRAGVAERIVRKKFDVSLRFYCLHSFSHFTAIVVG